MTYVDADDPPVLILHGDADGLMPVEQSLFLQRTLEDAGTDHQVHLVINTDHAFNGASDKQIGEIVETTTAFIARNTLD